MSIEAALAIALVVTCLIAFGVCAFAKWHRKRYLLIPYKRVNEFRTTPKFTVGGDAK
jgi:hypothetical protein